MTKKSYIQRILGSTILATSRSFRVLYVGGPRQVGKTTLLMHLSEERDMSYVTLDDLTLRRQAKQDPGLFLQQHPAPLFIDEVQYAPELFPYIKMEVDRRRENGLYWLSGSQHFSMIRGLQETLAGRVGIVSLLGLSLAEELGPPYPEQPFSPYNLPADFSNNLNTASLFKKIHRGSFPALVSGEVQDRVRFYSSYVQTYIERDVSLLFGVEKLEQFHRFLTLVCSRTAQVLNMSSLAADASVSVKTVGSWLSILESTGLVYLLRPYFRNVNKRMIRSPKLYVTDTGLIAYLTQWQSPETLMLGAMAGAVFETYVVSEILKSHLFRGFDAPIYFYRDKEKREVDLLFDMNGVLYPLEIKMTASVRPEDLASMGYVSRMFENVGQATFVSSYPRRMMIDNNVTTIPAWSIR